MSARPSHAPFRGMRGLLAAALAPWAAALAFVAWW